MNLIFGDDVNNNSKKMKVCRVDLIRLARPQLIKPCRVMLERRRGNVRENQVDYFQHVHINLLTTIKQRMENEQLFQLFHHGHQDDIFDSISPIKKRPLLSASSEMSDDDECTPSCSPSSMSVGPIQSWPVLTTSTPKKDELQYLSLNLSTGSCRYEHYAYIHKKLKEKKSRGTCEKKKRLQLLNEKGNFDSLVEIVKEIDDSGQTDEVTQCESYFTFETNLTLL